MSREIFNNTIDMILNIIFNFKDSLR